MGWLSTSPMLQVQKTVTRQLTIEPLISARKSIFPGKPRCSGKSVEPETCPWRSGETVFVSFLSIQFTNIRAPLGSDAVRAQGFWGARAPRPILTCLSHSELLGAGAGSLVLGVTIWCFRIEVERCPINLSPRWIPRGGDV